MRVPDGPQVLGWFGVARAISPDVRYRHPAVRSLEGNLASPSMLRSVSYAAQSARATPRPIDGHEVQTRETRAESLSR